MNETYIVTPVSYSTESERLAVMQLIKDGPDDYGVAAYVLSGQEMFLKITTMDTKLKEKFLKLVSKEEEKSKERNKKEAQRILTAYSIQWIDKTRFDHNNIDDIIFFKEREPGLFQIVVEYKYLPDTNDNYWYLELFSEIWGEITDVLFATHVPTIPGLFGMIRERGLNEDQIHEIKDAVRQSRRFE